MKLARCARLRIAHSPTPVEPMPQLTKLLGVSESVAREAAVADGEYVGAGCGVPMPSMIETDTMLARGEGITLGPVYPGKAMAGLIDPFRGGQYKKGQ